MKITINGKEIELKQTFRTLMLYENVTNQSFNNNGNLTNIVLYFFCNVLASSENPDITFDEFIDYIDHNNQVLTDYITWLNNQKKINGFFSLNTEGNTENKAEKKSKKK